MSNLNNILSLMYRMDKGYSKAVNLNEGGLAHTLLVEDKRINQARQRSREEIQKLYLERYNKQLTDIEIEQLLTNFENKFYHDPKMRSSSVMRLEPLFCRIAFEYGFNQQPSYREILARLNGMLSFLFKKQGEIDLAKVIPNTSLFTITYEDLEGIFGEILDQEGDMETQTIKNTEYVDKQQYDIVGPLDFETAHEIGSKSSIPGGELCYTRSEDTWSQYTNDGTNAAYAALQKGWDNFKAVHTPNFLSPYDETQTPTDESPYDKYGLSMIFVFVSPKGELTTCNTRWNHRADYPDGVEVDHALNRVQVSEIIGRRFTDVFIPNDELDVDYDEITEEMKQGDYSSAGWDIENVNDGVKYHQVYYCGKMNLFINNVPLFDKWVDYVGTGVYDGYAVFSDNGKYNYVNLQGEVLYKKPKSLWFDYAFPLYHGFAEVRIGDKYNVICANGQLLWNYPLYKWFDGISNFNLDVDKYIHVTIGGKMNLLKLDGTLLYKDGYDYISNSTEGYARIKEDNHYNFIDENGEIVWKHPFDEWFDATTSFNSGFAVVRKNKVYNVLRTDGSLVWDTLDTNDWFGHVGEFCFNRFFIVRSRTVQNLNFEYNLLSVNGHLVSNRWYHNITMLQDNETQYFYVQVDGKKNFIRSNGELIWNHENIDEWFDDVYDFENGEAVVCIDRKRNVLRFDGSLLVETEFIKDWFDIIRDCNCGYYAVSDDRGYNFLDSKGHLLLNEWYDYVHDFQSGYASVYKRKPNSDDFKINFIDTSGHILWERPTSEWFDQIGVLIEGTFVVRLGDKYNFFDVKKRNLVNNVLYDEVYHFAENCARIRKNEMYNYIRHDGTYVWNKPFNQWFSAAEKRFYDGFARVRIGLDTYYLKNDGTLYRKK